MRTLRWIVAGIAVVTALAIPTVAAADGGAYIELDRTHHLVGSTATGVAYVAVPEPKQHLLERGPFYAYVLPARAWIQEGRPIPAGAIRVGTVTIERVNRKAFELHVSFTVPDLPGDYYNVAICNDPCTIAGFREPLSAYMSIVETAREGDLLTANSHLQTKAWTLRRQVRKAERANEELVALLEENRAATSELSFELNRAQRELGSAAAISVATADVQSSDDRSIVGGWALVAIVGVLIVGLLAWVFSRRTAKIVVPDTIAELEDEAELQPAGR
jgi:hypothetical protein